MMDIWFFGFDLRLAGYSKRRGLAIGSETLEPVTFKIYEYARQMKPAQFMGAMSALNSRPCKTSAARMNASFLG